MSWQCSQEQMLATWRVCLKAGHTQILVSAGKGNSPESGAPASAADSATSSLPTSQTPYPRIFNQIPVNGQPSRSLRSRRRQTR